MCIEHYLAVFTKIPGEKTTNKLKSKLFTKQACRDTVVVYSLFFSNNIYFALLICIEHCFTNIELYTLYICVYIYIYIYIFH